MLAQPERAFNFRRLAADGGFVGLEESAKSIKGQVHRLISVEKEVHSGDNMGDRRGPDGWFAARAIRRFPPADPFPKFDGETGEFGIQMELAELVDQNRHFVEASAALRGNPVICYHEGISSRLRELREPRVVVRKYFLSALGLELSAVSTGFGDSVMKEGDTSSRSSSRALERRCQVP